MNRLMKASDEARQSSVRLFKSPAAVLPASRPEALDEADTSEQPAEPARLMQPNDLDDHFRKQVGRLETEVEQLRAQLEDALARAETREEQAFERGHEAGVHHESQKGEKRIALLEKGLDEALKQFVNRQAEIEVLALSIAKATLGRVLVSEENYADLVGNAIEAQLARMRGQLVLAVQVSTDDFSNGAQLDALRARFSHLDIIPKAELPSGGCLMNLKLGQLDIGLPGQWLRIQDLFAELAGEAATAP